VEDWKPALIKSARVKVVPKKLLVLESKKAAGDAQLDKNSRAAAKGPSAEFVLPSSLEYELKSKTWLPSRHGDVLSPRDLLIAHANKRDRE
jgi:hypothetical protein